MIERAKLALLGYADVTHDKDPRRPDSHKAWIFAEDLSREFERSGLGLYPMNEADGVVDMIVITKIHGRELKRALRLAEDLLAKHYLTDDVIIEHGPGENLG